MPFPPITKAVSLDMTQRLVDPDWELIDPTPDVHAMFTRFDKRFFGHKLSCVTLEWSKRMYSCAGICYSRRNKFGSAVTIRLSEPLLKLRTRKNLIETLLHEMIHAYCFVLGIREGNGGHGPRFCEMMKNINKVAGTNITVYHSYYDEVNLYKKHVWKCNGICQHRKPFFGYVRRTSNRAPGPNDFWWPAHKQQCGGYFQKVSGPEATQKSKTEALGAPREFKRGKRKNVKDSIVDQPRITDFLKTSPTDPAVSSSSIPVSPASFPGKGQVLHSASDKGEVNELERLRSIQDQVRSSWLKRFGTATKDSNATTHKKQKLSSGGASSSTESAANNGSWIELDSDVFVRPSCVEVISLIDSSEDDDDDENNGRNNNTNDCVSADADGGDREFKEYVRQVNSRSVTNKSVAERRLLIQRELLDGDEDDLATTDDTIDMIDNEYDDNETAAPEPFTSAAATAQFIDPVFLRELLEMNAAQLGGSSSTGDQDSEFVQCLICGGTCERVQLAQHIEEGCMGIRQQVMLVKPKGGRDLADSLRAPSTIRTVKNTWTVPGGHNRNINSNDAISLLDTSSSSEENRFACPNCNMKYSETRMNEHLDTCLVIDSD